MMEGEMAAAKKLRAAALKKRYGVYGHFYGIQLGGTHYDCRSVLELIAHDGTPRDIQAIQSMDPGLLVVMMNPGSSRPLDGGYEPRTVRSVDEIAKAQVLTPTRPDNTQYQIMRLMAAAGVGHARVLNLSDLREPKSPLLMRQLVRLEGVRGGEGHSLFGGGRDAAFRALAGPEGAVPVLAGWGRHRALEPLARQCLKRLAGWRIIGVRPDEGQPLYAHPSPMLQRMKDQWLDIVMRQLSGR
ncbi:MAG: DUF1643 domain-containing protein [Magnetococcales bacterium]|nr:DUF1643 domain-containing protein [Magnetococcales bacterium]